MAWSLLSIWLSGPSGSGRRSRRPNAQGLRRLTCSPRRSFTRVAWTSSSGRLGLRLPTIYQSPEFAEEGGLIGYGPRLTQMFRQMARQLAKVLSGEKVSDVPVEQPTTFELAINLQAAKAISFAIPQSLVLRANKVIE